MALTFQNGDPVKQALYEELQNILNPNTEIRSAAEVKVKQLEFTEGYGVYLAELIMNQSFDFALRQLSCIMLTKYVEEHWNSASSTDGVYIATDAAKRVIRNVLPTGLYDPNSKLRTSVAYTISTIATYDWPETWPELFDIIVKCLAGNEDSVHGAMQVLVEFTYDLNEQTPIVGPIIISELYRIIEAEQFYSIKTRSCAIKIFKSLLKSINEHVQSIQKQSEMLLPLLGGFINKFIALLSSTNPFSNFVLKNEIIKVFVYMVNSMPRFIQPFATQILPPIWQLLTQSADLYVKAIVNEESNPFEGNADEEETETESFTTMVLQMIEFIHSSIESKPLKVHVKNVLTDLIYTMITYMQITQDQMEEWADSPERFVDDDYQEDYTDSTSIRISCNDVLVNLSTEFSSSKILPALNHALSRHIAVIETEQSKGNVNRWKIHEASMCAVGYYRELILSKSANFNLSEYLNYVRNIIGTYQNESYLVGRCLWLLCRFARSEIYNNQMLAEIFDIITNSLTVDKPMSLRIYAVRAISEFCDALPNLPPERCTLFISKLGGFVDGMFTMIPTSKNAVLVLLTETLSTVIAVNVNFTASIHNRIIPLTIAIFLKYHEDPFTLENVKEMLSILAQNQYCLGPLKEKIIPTLASILNATEPNANLSMQDTSLEILEILVKHSKAPLCPQLIEIAFPAAAQCILRSDDPAILQSGSECLRLFISVSPQQVCSYKNGEGLKYIMTISETLLNPMHEEHTAAFVGRLVITLINKAGNLLGENIYLLLKAVISKLQMVVSLSVAMSLVITFAHLFVTQMEAVLNFLSTIPGPTGEPAIQFVFTHWLTRQPSFYGMYERKVSTLALCNLLEYGVTTKDIRLTSVTIRELINVAATDQEQSEADGCSTAKQMKKHRTRSQTVQQWTSIPVLVKIFKLLINELCNARESNLNLHEDDEGPDTDEDEEDDNTNNNNNNNINSPDPTDAVESILVSDLPLFAADDIAERDDYLMEELQQNPFFQGNMEEKLTKFLQDFSQNKAFGEFVAHLGEGEKLILQSIQVNVH